MSREVKWYVQGHMADYTQDKVKASKPLSLSACHAPVHINHPRGVTLHRISEKRVSSCSQILYTTNFTPQK